MQRTRRTLGGAAVCALALATLAPATAVRAETLNCTPLTSLPAVISAPGVYCLTEDLATAIASGNAVTIEANNVVLDLNRHRIGGLSAGPATSAVGIYAYQRQNVTILNGTLRGFYIGVHLDDSFPYTVSQGHVIEDLRVERSTYTAIQALGRGILVRRNQVVATGGSALFADEDAFGILVGGPSNEVAGNSIANTFGLGTGSGYGIRFYFAPNGLALGNRITDATSGIGFLASSGKYRDNVTSGVLGPYGVIPVGSATDAGNNN